MKTTIKIKMNRAKLQIQKHSPEILTGLGVVSFIGTIVVASRAGLKARKVLDKYHEEKNDISEATEKDEEYAVSEERQQDVLGTYGRAASGLAKTYAPTIALSGLSLACFLTANHILKGRYLMAVSAYNAVSGAFEAYRKRVREEEGDDADRHYMFGTERKQIEVEKTDEKGKKKKEQQEVEVAGSSGDLSEYIRYFEEGNKNWDPDPGISFMFLRAQQTIWNNILQTRGHVFLNEVLDGLGFEMTQIGGVAGWVLGNGDDYIDFGMDDTNPAIRRFINGEDNVVPLEFNCDGLILNKI